MKNLGIREPHPLRRPASERQWVLAHLVLRENKLLGIATTTTTTEDGISYLQRRTPRAARGCIKAESNPLS